MSRPHELLGKKFGNLTVVEKIGLNKHQEVTWKCICECGETHKATGHNLVHGITTCCTKCKIEKIRRKNTTHGCLPRRLHETYTNMKTRCDNPKYKDFDRYGGRGIKVCEEWENSYEAFREWAFSTGYNESLTIDRINNDGNYEPSNCKWSTMQEQSNNRCTNRIITVDGISDTMANWAKKYDIPYHKIQDRLNKENSAEEYIRGFISKNSG